MLELQNCEWNLKAVLNAYLFIITFIWCMLVCVRVQLCMKYTYLHNFIIEQAVVNSPKMK